MNKRHELSFKVIAHYRAGTLTLPELVEELASVIAEHPCSCLGCLS